MTKEQARERAKLIEQAIKNEAMSKAEETLACAASPEAIFQVCGAIISLFRSWPIPLKAGGVQ